jgi:hypothetical protein
LNSVEFIASNANGTSFYDEFVSVPISRTQWLQIRDGNKLTAFKFMIINILMAKKILRARISIETQRNCRTV